MSQTSGKIRFQLLSLDRQQKNIQLQRIEILKELSDSEKNKKKLQIMKEIYKLVLTCQYNDEIDFKNFGQNILNKLSQDEYEFFNAHKHDNFYSHRKLLRFFEDNEEQVALKKHRYINIHYFNKNKLSTLHQIFSYITFAKIQQHKDILLNELKSLRIKEQLRYTLFEKEGFNQIIDFNERECLLMLKSYSNLKDKDLIKMTGISRSSWYRYKDKFFKLGLL